MIDTDNLPKKRIRNPGRKAMAKACAGTFSPSVGWEETPDGKKVQWSRTRTKQGTREVRGMYRG